jgi:hypothetical protein
MHIILPNGQAMPIQGGPQTQPPEVSAAFNYLGYAQQVRVGPMTHEGQLPLQRELTELEKNTQRAAHSVLLKYFQAYDPKAETFGSMEFHPLPTTPPEPPGPAAPVTQ